MTSLESIVLPFAESRSLVEHKIVLGTALSWFVDMLGVAKPVVLAHDFLNSRYDEIPAPVLSELLDAIWAKYPDAVISTFRRKGFGADVDIDDDLAGFHKGAGLYPTDLLAAAALLTEVSK